MAILFTPREYSTPPLSQAARSNPRLSILIDNFTLTTWLLIGACLQGELYMIISRRISIILLIPHIILLWRSTYALLMHYGFVHNTYMDHVVQGIYTAQIPKSDGTYKLSDEEVIVFLVGACLNHPLGILAPGANDFVQYFASMKTDLEKNRAKYGMLGGSSWTGNKERATNNDILYIYYFKDIEGVQRFAQDVAHRDGWDWYTRFMKGNSYLAIRHELYYVPKNHWENVFLNSHPTLFGATVSQVNSAGEEEKWMGPVLVDGKESKLKTIRGRLGLLSRKVE